MLEINEIFGPTIQGEGLKSGTPSVFIRFGRCNLQCSGFNVEYVTPSGVKKCSCDSYFASDIAFRDSWKKFNSFKDLVKEVDKLIKYKPIDIVITGGEPLLYWHDEEFQKLLKYYITNNFNLTIETNASLDIKITKDYQKKILFSMSVKLSNSGESEKKRINYNTINEILTNANGYLKFVIDKEFLKKAKTEIKNILKNIKKCKVFVMPRGDSKEELEKNSKYVVDFAIKNGFYYSDRLHIRLWDGVRGV